MAQIFSNRNFILVLSFVTGFLFSDLANYTTHLTIPVLAVIFTVSITQVNIEDILPLKTLIRPFMWSVFFSYIILGSLSLGLAWLLLPEEYWVGYAIIAASPPGAAIMPFTYVRSGNIPFSLMGTFTTYLSALVITPALLFIITGGVLVSPLNLFLTMFQIILIPFIISRLIIKFDLTPHIEKWRSIIINWGFFVVIFTVVGLNREVFFTEPTILLRVCLIAVLTTFVLGALVEYFSDKTGYFSGKENISLALISTIKNMGFASTLAITFFEDIASVPAAITAAVYALYFIYLGITAKE